MANPSWPISQCSADVCRARVIWARTAAARPMMVDAEPSPVGTIRLAPLGAGVRAAVLKGPDLAAARSAGEPLRTSHFATCPCAGEFRRDARKKKGSSTP